MATKQSGYRHAWDWRCKHYLQWQAYGRKKIAALLCPDCGKDYPVGGSTPYKLGGGKTALAAVEVKN
jgi:hypothetical protein